MACWTPCKSIRPPPMGIRVRVRVRRPCQGVRPPPRSIDPPAPRSPPLFSKAPIRLDPIPEKEPPRLEASPFPVSPGEATPGDLGDRGAGSPESPHGVGGRGRARVRKVMVRSRTRVRVRGGAPGHLGAPLGSGRAPRGRPPPRLGRVLGPHDRGIASSTRRYRAAGVPRGGRRKPYAKAPGG